MKCEMCGWDDERSPTRTWVASVEFSYPSQNDLGGNHKSGFKYRNFRNKLAKLLKDQLNDIPAAMKYRVGIITRYYGVSAKGKQKRAYDEENLVGGGKPLIDVLKDYAVILDDNPSAWKGYYKQAKAPDGVDRIHIQLMEY